MARNRTSGGVENRAAGEAPSRVGLTRPPALASPEERNRAKVALLERLARRLEPSALEEEVLVILEERLPGHTALVTLAGPSAEPSRFRDASGTRPWPAGREIPPLLAAPIRDRNETHGWIAFVDEAGEDEEAARFREAARALLPAVADALAVPAGNARRFAHALDAALKDPLTGLYNRRAFEDFLERETEAARRYGRPLSLVIADVDEFKRINDTWGHPVGDLALRRLATVLEEEARRSDIVARIGGDEFAIIVPACDASCAFSVGSRILRRLERIEIAPPGCADLFRIGVSLGVSDLQMAQGETDTLIEIADRALLGAKRAGGGTIGMRVQAAGGSRRGFRG